MESRNSEAFCFIWGYKLYGVKYCGVVDLNKMLLICLSFVSYLYPVHSCVVYRRLRYSARSTRTRWTSLHNKRYLTVYSSFTVFNGHFKMLEIIWSLALASLFVF